MWINVIIVIGALILLSASFLIGFFVGLSNALDMMEEPEDEPEEKLYLYCFQCEFNMSVKEVAGVLYCGNCGLRH